jgi:hypothetical protein
VIGATLRAALRGQRTRSYPPHRERRAARLAHVVASAPPSCASCRSGGTRREKICLRKADLFYAGPPNVQPRIAHKPRRDLSAR